MMNLKKEAEKWAKEVLSKQVEVSHEEFTCQFQEFMVLGSLLYDENGNWIPRLNLNQSFEVKPAKIKNGKIKI